MRLTFLFVSIPCMLWSAIGSENFSIYAEPDCSARFLSVSGESFSVSGILGFGIEGVPTSSNFMIKTGYFSAIGIDTLDPAAVENLSAESLESGDIKLSWNASYDTESWIKSYRIYRSSIQGVFGAFMAETDGTEYYDCSGLVSGVKYYYNVRPADIAGNEPEAGNLQVSVLSRSLSTSVKTLCARSLQGGSIELSWDQISGSAFYRIYRSEEAGDKGVLVSLDYSVGGGIFADTPANGIINGRRYFYIVQYVDSAGNEQIKGNSQSSAPCDSESPSLPVISNSTHPEGGLSDNPSPEFDWLESVDPNSSTFGASGLSGYRFYVSRLSDESYSKNWPFTSEETIKPGQFEDGDWYLYLSSEDAAGNFSAPIRYKFGIKTKGSVSGKVTDPAGKMALKLIRVELLSAGKIAAVALTGLNGEYCFKEVSFGRYSLRVLRPGFAPYEVSEFELAKSSPDISLQSSASASPVLGAGGMAAYPNPVRGSSVTFVYNVERPCAVSIEIFDSAGSKVAAGEDYQVITGFRETKKDIAELSTGVYLYFIKLIDGEGDISKLPLQRFSVIRQ